MELKTVDFFCGAGGMSQGFKQAGIDAIAALDNDKKCEATYMANHPNTRFICEDITQFTPEDLLERTGIQQNDDDAIFVGCAPCQYWSNIRHSRQKSYATRNLLKEFLKFVNFFTPGYVVVENVIGIDTHREESGLKELCSSLRDKKYYIHLEHKFSTRDYGVPQTRRRFLLIASRHPKTIKLKKEKQQQTFKQAVGKLPPIKAGECHKDDPLHRSPKLSEINIRRLEETKEGKDRSGWMHIDELMIDAYRGKPISYHRYNYGRMAWDQLAPTITTRFTSLGCGRFGHPQDNRAISLREGALLQTFKRDYDFCDHSTQTTARLIGNAVPPLFAQKIGEAIISSRR